MPRRKKGKLESVDALLKNVYPAPDQLDAAKVFTWWGRAVPARILNNARPVRLSHGTLVVHVTSSVWANELHYLSEDLLTRLREFAPQIHVKKIQFRVGTLPELRAHRPQPAPAPEPVHLASLPEELGRALGRVHDDALREAITQAATTTLARRRTKR